MNMPRMLEDEEIEETLAQNGRTVGNRSELTQLIENLKVKQGFELGPFEDFKQYNTARSGISMKMRSISWYAPKTGCVAMRKIEKDGQFYLRIIRMPVED